MGATTRSPAGSGGLPASQGCHHGGNLLCHERMSRRTANIVITALLLVLIGLIYWMTKTLDRLEKVAASRKKPAAQSASPKSESKPEPKPEPKPDS